MSDYSLSRLGCKYWLLTLFFKVVSGSARFVLGANRGDRPTCPEWQAAIGYGQVTLYERCLSSLANSRLPAGSRRKIMPKRTGGVGPDATDLMEKLAAWMNSEGYPTEFRTANIFRKYGFHTTQGEYIKGAEDTKREIDVLARNTYDRDFGFIRACYVAECKWALNKPWVVFVSLSTRMATSALAAQTISSILGSAVMWVIAGHEKLKSMDTFLVPERGGFGGRQAFSTGRDHFYSAMQSVVANAVFYTSSYHEEKRWLGAMPEAVRSCISGYCH